MRIVDCHRIVFLGGFPCGSAGKESTSNAGHLGSISGLEDPWRRERLPSPVFWPGELHGCHGVAKSRLSNFQFTHLTVHKTLIK